MNDKQVFESTQSALRNIENALFSLREEVLPLNRLRYYVMAEPVIDDIKKLRKDLDKVLGIYEQDSKDNLTLESLNEVFQKIEKEAPEKVTLPRKLVNLISSMAKDPDKDFPYRKIGKKLKL